MPVIEDTKTCPYCAEDIQSEAIKCKHCGSWITAAGGAPLAPHRWTRSSTDKMWSGVCGGLGQYLGVDPTFVRIVAAVGTFLSGGIGLVIYWILVWVVPLDKDVYRV